MVLTFCVMRRSVAQQKQQADALKTTNDQKTQTLMQIKKEQAQTFEITYERYLSRERQNAICFLFITWSTNSHSIVSQSIVMLSAY
jgi:hypothetical protein